jgi:adenine-specific DNA methylase
MVDLFSTIFSDLGAVSSIAVIAGAIFVVFQLRQNSKLIQATLLENKANVSLALLEKITEESFARRRKKMHDTVKKFAAANWEGFDDSLEDFEARNFGYLYELIGQLAREGVVDLRMVINALQYLVVVDWQTFEPLVAHVKKRYNVKFNAWANFKWLSDETQRHMANKVDDGDDDGPR